MTGNRSLDDFLDSGDDEAGETASESESVDDFDSVDTDDDAGEAAADSGDDPRTVDESSDADDSDTIDGSDTVDKPGTGDDPDTVDEPRTTLRWTPGGVDCPACGTRVERQWRDGDRFVCADCKEW